MPPLQVVSAARIQAETVVRLNVGESMAELLGQRRSER